MNNYQYPIRQLVTELEVLSRTSRGRALHIRLREAGIDVAGAESALEVAQLLEWDPRAEPVPNPLIEDLVAHSKGDPEVALVLLVALRRALGEVVFSIGRLSSDPDIVAEIIVELLAGLADLSDATSVDELLGQAYRNARRTVRRQERVADREVDWELGMDVEGFKNRSDLPDNEILRAAVHSGVLTNDDAELIRVTRVDGVTLNDVARARRVKYRRVQRRRHRAERVVREFLRKSEDL